MSNMSATAAVSPYDANAQLPYEKGLKLFNQTLEAATSANANVLTKLNEMYDEVKKLQTKAGNIKEGNQGRVKKMQRNSDFAMPKIKELQSTKCALGVMLGDLRFRQGDYELFEKIKGRATTDENEDLYLAGADEKSLKLINQRRETEGEDVQKALAILAGLPMEFT